MNGNFRLFHIKVVTKLEIPEKFRLPPSQYDSVIVVNVFVWA